MVYMSVTSLYTVVVCKNRFKGILLSGTYSEERFGWSGYGTDCHDVGKEPLCTIDECIEAANELGRSNFEGYVSWFDVTKGCIVRGGRAYWNRHETGKTHRLYQSICREHSKYNLQNSIKQYQIYLSVKSFGKLHTIIAISKPT